MILDTNTHPIRLINHEGTSVRAKLDYGLDPRHPFYEMDYPHGVPMLNWESEEHDYIRNLPPEDIYTKSPVRDGLEIWDRCFGTPACTWRTIYNNVKGVAPFRRINTYTDKRIMPAILSMRPISPTEWVRPKDTYIMDLPSYSVGNIDGYDILLMASVMAQHEVVHVPFGPSLPVRFKTWAARIQVAMTYGLPIWSGEWDWYRAGDMFPPNGIIVNAGKSITDLNSIMPFNRMGSMVPDKTVAVINVAVGNGAIPSEFIRGKRSGNRHVCFSCSPMTMAIVGWDTADSIVRYPILDGWDAYVMPWESLHSPNLLPTVSTTTGIKVFESLWLTDFFKQLYYTAEPHPAPDSLAFTNRMDIGVVRPSVKRPPKSITSGPAYTVWKAYDESLGSIRDIITKEAASREFGITKEPYGTITRRQRSRNWAKLLLLGRRVQRHEKRELKLRREGFLSKADAEKSAKEKVQAEIAQLGQPKEKG